MEVSAASAKEAAKTGVKRFIEVSTAQVYNCDKVGPHSIPVWTENR